MQNQNNSPKGNIGNEKELAALSYMWIFSVIILLAKRDNEFIQHHARRGVVLFILSLLLWILPVLRYGELVVLVFMVLGFITAALGNENTLPILSEIADCTLRPKDLKKYWGELKSGARKIAKPDENVAPLIKNPGDDEDRVKGMQAKVEEKMEEVEERKISTLYNRINEDEKRIEKLEDEVKGLKK